MFSSMFLNTVSNFTSLPEAPEIDTSHLSDIINLWNYSDSASEITSVFQNLFSRLPPYFLAYFALSFLFIVVGLLVHLINQVL